MAQIKNSDEVFFSGTEQDCKAVMEAVLQGSDYYCRSVTGGSEAFSRIENLQRRGPTNFKIVAGADDCAHRNTRAEQLVHGIRALCADCGAVLKIEQTSFAPVGGHYYEPMEDDDHMEVSG